MFGPEIGIDWAYWNVSEQCENKPDPYAKFMMWEMRKMFHKRLFVGNIEAACTAVVCLDMLGKVSSQTTGDAVNLNWKNAKITIK